MFGSKLSSFADDTAAAAVPAVAQFCGRLAPFSSVLMYMSPIPTIRHVVRKGCVGDLPLLPYTVMVAGNFVWIVYGFLEGESKIWMTNFVEFSLSVYYFIEFTNYAPQVSPTFPGAVYSHIYGILATWLVALLVTIFLPRAIAVHWVGEMTVLLTVATYASPLAAVRAVVQKQNSEAIPWPFTLAALGNNTLWVIWGVWELHDFYVYFPSVVALLLALAQVALKLYYGDSSNNSKKDANHEQQHSGHHYHYLRTPTSVEQQQHQHQHSHQQQQQQVLPNAVLQSSLTTAIFHGVRQVVNYGNTTDHHLLHGENVSDLQFAAIDDYVPPRIETTLATGATTTTCHNNNNYTAANNCMNHHDLEQTAALLDNSNNNNNNASNVNDNSNSSSDDIFPQYSAEALARRNFVRGNI